MALILQLAITRYSLLAVDQFQNWGTLYPHMYVHKHEYEQEHKHGHGHGHGRLFRQVHGHNLRLLSNLFIFTSSLPIVNIIFGN